MTDDLAFRSASDLARLVRAGEVSSVELVDLYLDRIERFDGDLNAYVEVIGEQARLGAKAKDEQTVAGGDLPPFHGVPISIKDEHLLAGTRTTFGSRTLRDLVLPFDGENVARLKRAGLVPLGKTAMPEFGILGVTESELYGATRNPWDLDRTPGGSSGGAAAALAAGLCPVSDGADGAGSIRIPASCCGLFGLKASRDRISNAPMFGDLGFGLVTPGVITRTVEDSAALLDVLAGPVAGDPGIAPPPDRPFAEEVGRDPGRLRVAVDVTPPIGESSAEVRAAVADARSLLEQFGHDTVEVRFDYPADVVDRFLDIWSALVAAQPLPVNEMEPITQWLVQRATSASAARYVQSQHSLQTLCRTLAGQLAATGADFLLQPTLAELPLRIGAVRSLEPEAAFTRMAMAAPFTALANISGLPAASLPLHWDEATGLPVGVQLVGPPAGESALLRLCAQLEAARPWADRHPPIYA